MQKIQIKFTRNIKKKEKAYITETENELQYGPPHFAKKDGNMKSWEGGGEIKLA